MKKIKKFNFSFLYFLLLIPFFRTDYIQNQYEKISIVFNCLKICSIVFIIFIAIKNRYLSKKFQLVLIFSLSIIIPTIVYQGDLMAALGYITTFIVLAYLIDYFKTNLKFISTMLFCFEILIYINFFSMIIFPNGMYTTGNAYTGTATQNWILGFKNVMISYFLPAIIISNIYKNLTGNKKRNIILTSIIFLSTILSESATSIIGIFVMILFNIISTKKNMYNVFNLKNYFISSIVLFIMVVFLQIQNKFQYFFVDILKKDITFSNRTILWNITIKRILEKPILGHGWQSNSIRHIMYNSHTIITSHNQFLEYLYIGGIITLGLYFFLIMITNHQIKNNYKDKNIQIISLGFFILQILNLTEVYLNPIIMIVFLLLLYSNNYVKGSENKVE